MSEARLVIYSDIEAKVSEIKEACDFLPDVSTKDGYEASKRVSLDVGKVLTNLEKARKNKKAGILEEGRVIDSEAKRLAAVLEQLQLPHKEAYKELDNLKKEREAKRKQDLEDRVAEIRNLPEAMRDMDSGSIQDAMQSLGSEECLDFYEHTEHALKARNASKTALSELYVAKLKAEKEAKELEELREKNRIQEQKDRDQAIIDKAKAEAEKEKQEAIERENAAIEAKKKAVEDARLAAEKAEKDRIEAEAKAKQEKEKAAESARLAEVARQNKIAEDARKEREAREADTKHKKKVNSDIFRAITAEKSLNIDNEEVAKLIMLISEGNIPNIKINY